MISYVRNIEVQKLSSRPVNDILLDNLLNLKYTPYIKFVYNKEDKDKPYFIVSFLSDKGSKVTSIKTIVSKNKLIFNY